AKCRRRGKAVVESDSTDNGRCNV
ncbi:hypothetical protein M513_08015, partial [Trichuris suis]